MMRYGGSWSGSAAAGGPMGEVIRRPGLEYAPDLWPEALGDLSGQRQRPREAPEDREPGEAAEISSGRSGGAGKGPRSRGGCRDRRGRER